MLNEIKTKKAPRAIGPYVQGIEAKGLIFVSGQIPIEPKSGTIPESILLQTTQSLNNIQSIVKKAGLSIKNIVKTTIFVKNLNDFDVVNQAYETFFKKQKIKLYPARSCVEVSRLPKDVLIEIEAIAIK